MDFDMHPKIIENYGDCGVNVGKIVNRIIKFAPPASLQGLNQIRIMDKDPNGIGFACYYKEDAKIEIFIDDIVGWQPWPLKKSYVFPYLSIGLALGHEIDHHVKRQNNRIDKEEHAESNALKYVYPSFGIFKPIAKIISFLLNKK